MTRDQGTIIIFMLGLILGTTFAGFLLVLDRLPK